MLSMCATSFDLYVSIPVLTFMKQCKGHYTIILFALTVEKCTTYHHQCLIPCQGPRGPKGDKGPLGAQGPAGPMVRC